MNRLKPTKINSRYNNLQWMNTIVSLHDMRCECNDPLEHTVLQIFHQEKQLRFTKEEQKIFQTCLTIPGEGSTEEEDAFGAGDLENLFSEPFGEDEDTTKKEDG